MSLDDSLKGDGVYRVAWCAGWSQEADDLVTLELLEELEVVNGRRVAQTFCLTEVLYAFHPHYRDPDVLRRWMRRVLEVDRARPWLRTGGSS